MIRENILAQFYELQKIFPLLTCVETENDVIIEGTLDFNAEYNNTPIADSYSIRMSISNDFPRSVPQVWETDHRISCDYKHFLEDGSLCLGVRTEIALQLGSNPSLVYFVTTFIVNYFYSASYYDKYGVMPFGERSHGVEGIYEFYKEFFDVQSNRQVLMLLKAVCFKKFRGHLLCPCGSGMIMRKCKHKEKIIQSINSDFLICIQSDFAYLIEIGGGQYGKIRTTEKRI